MKKRILALLLTLALVLPAVSCDILLADPNAPVNPSDSQSESNNNTPDTEKTPEKGPEVHTQPQTPPDSEPETNYYEPETEYIPKEYTVTFVLKGYDEQPDIQIVTEGNLAKKPTVKIDPAVGTFEGAWYTEPVYDTPYKFDFNTPITEDITLYGYVIPNPAAPALIMDAEALHALAGAAAPNVQMVGTSEVITEGKYTFARWTAAGGDPYVAIIPLNSSYTLPQYMAISYRTNSTSDGQFFLGSGAGWTGDGDHFNYDWNENGEWNLAVIDLTNVGVTSITDGLLTYCRLDFFNGMCAEGDYIDFAYIGFFNSPEYAQAYDFEHYPPYVELDDRAAGKINHSIDTFYVNGQMYFPEDGHAGDKLTAIGNTISFGIDEAHDSMTLRGWIGFGQAIDSFGYYVDNYTMIYSPDFTKPTEDGVKAAGGEHASRFEITVPLADLERGTHTVGFVVKLEDGTVVRLREEITVVIPTHYADYNVPQDQWVVSGHCPQIVPAWDHTHSPMVEAAGVESAALLHQGSIYLGEIDLSKYSKVIIYNGTDNSQVTVNHYNANARNWFMLLNQDMNMVMSPAEDTIIACDTYTLHGWAVEAYEIDLTGIDYYGPVYVGWDTLPGTFMLISSIEFIGAEISDEETEAPVEPETPVVENYNIPMESWTISGHQPQLITPDVAGIGPIVAVVGMEKAALLHQGSVGVGEVDLSKYSKVVIQYTIDASQGTYDMYNASGKQIYVLNADMNMVMSPDATTVVTSATFNLPELNHSWQMQTIEINLSAIDYNGPVYVTWDTLPGSFMLIGSVEFISGEIQ